MSFSPIILFVYNRADHAEKVLKAINENPEFHDSPLYIYCDGPKNNASEKDLISINETRSIVKNKKYWSSNTTVIESDINKGLAASIIDGVTEVIEKHGTAIILEDDIITSKGFLKYMNEALSTYKKDTRVMHINAYLPKSPFQKNTFKETTFYSTHMSCWGWATWKDSWTYFNNNTDYLIDTLKEKKLDSVLDLEYRFHGMEQLYSNQNGLIKTWAIKWGASILLNDGICLNASTSLVQNIGMDGSGINSGKLFWNPFKTTTTDSIKINILKDDDYLKGNDYFGTFFKYVNIKGIRRKLIKLYYYLFD